MFLWASRAEEFTHFPLMGQKEKVGVEVEVVDGHGDDSSSSNSKILAASLVISVSGVEIWKR